MRKCNILSKYRALNDRFFTKNVLNQIIYFTTDFYDIAIYMAINISFIVANQLFYSIQLKSNKKIHKAQKKENQKIHKAIK